ncbi:hypothetical protein pgond44_01275 [Psychroflexus gondwanensis ACAM 44]|uniref:Uncharacterized protein n=1 Tax=Psychroflexus gondwanensis ACAM 44 TaxID=1189619 RepID=N1WR00_9FLAO|nr:hypothetical protein [Psychroflexus gondwanensis]EMY82711.1 hypothetical protein pgond44_01275 [Psychroflexus gondwanensis ACAM 44]
MTEIKIEKKKPVWPWILLVLVLLIVAFAAWFFFIRNDNAEPVATSNETTDETADEIVDETSLIDINENNNIVASYVTFINADNATMGLDHVFTSEAFAKLTNAVDAMATEVGYDVKADIAEAKQLVDEITNEPMAAAHADKIRSGANVLSTCLQNIQQAKYSGLSAEAADVKSAASAINPETLTLNQRDAVKPFFRKAADLLNKMN